MTFHLGCGILLGMSIPTVKLETPKFKSFGHKSNCVRKALGKREFETTGRSYLTYKPEILAIIVNNYTDDAIAEMFFSMVYNHGDDLFRIFASKFPLAYADYDNRYLKVEQYDLTPDKVIPSFERMVGCFYEGGDSVPMDYGDCDDQLPDDYGT